MGRALVSQTSVESLEMQRGGVGHDLVDAGLEA